MKNNDRRNSALYPDVNLLAQIAIEIKYVQEIDGAMDITMICPAPIPYPSVSPEKILNVTESLMRTLAQVDWHKQPCMVGNETCETCTGRNTGEHMRSNILKSCSES